MMWSLPLIVFAGLVLLILEVRAVHKNRLLRARQLVWPQFEETFISALESGLTVSDAFIYCQEFGLAALREPIDELVFSLDRGTQVDKAVRVFGRRIDISFADLFVEIVCLAQRTGGQNLIPALTEHVGSVRLELSASGAIESRTGAILTVGKLGLLAPWLLLAMLCVNERNRESFDSQSGGLLLLGGFALSLLAFRLVVKAGSMKPRPRVFGN